ncbi:MAG: sugar nucleotide-binding protein [Verrucomicrobiales bacterium]
MSFLDSIIQRSIAGEGQAAIADQFSTPCYSEDFAELLEPLLAPGGPAGLLHLCNDGACSWQEYGQRGIDAVLAAGIAFKTRQPGLLQLDEMDAFTAPRPRHTAMSTAKYAALTGKTPRPWEDAVDAYVRGRAWR